MPGTYSDRLIIADTSCLIALTNTGNLDILKNIGKSVCITPEILHEFGEHLPPWIQIVPVKNTAKMRAIRQSLGIGESSAIALALETANPLLILDDGKARRLAKHTGITMTGTAGLLIAAYENGFLPDLHGTLDLLRERNFRLPPDIAAHIPR